MLPFIAILLILVAIYFYMDSKENFEVPPSYKVNMPTNVVARTDAPGGEAVKPSVLPGGLLAGPYAQIARNNPLPYDDPALQKTNRARILKLLDDVKGFLAFEAQEIEDKSDPSIQLPLGTLRGDFGRLESEVNVLQRNPGLQPEMTELQIAEIEDNLAYLQRQVRLYGMNRPFGDYEWDKIAMSGFKNYEGFTNPASNDLTTKVQELQALKTSITSIMGSSNYADVTADLTDLSNAIDLLINDIQSIINLSNPTSSQIRILKNVLETGETEFINIFENYPTSVQTYLRTFINIIGDCINILENIRISSSVTSSSSGTTSGSTGTTSGSSGTTSGSSGGTAGSSSATAGTTSATAGSSGTTSGSSGTTSGSSGTTSGSTSGTAGSSGTTSGSSGTTSSSTGTTSDSSTTDLATLQELKDFSYRLQGEILRLTASGSTNPVTLQRVANLNQLKLNVDEVIRKYEKGDITTIPIRASDIKTALPILGNPNSPLPTLLRELSLPAGLANLLPANIKNDPSMTKKISELIDKYAEDFFKGTTAAVNFSVKYTSPREAKVEKDDDGFPTQQQLDNASGSPYIMPNGGYQKPGSGFPATLASPSGGAPLKTYDDPRDIIIGNFDWKERARQIEEQVRRRGLNPSDFAILPTGSKVSDDFSWRGYTKMICNRLKATPDPGLPQTVGCPADSWQGWNL